MIVKFFPSTPKLDIVERNLKNLNLKSIGTAGVADVMRNIDTRGRNIGEEWPPLKFRSGQPLRDNAILYGSIHAVQAGNVVYIIASRTAFNKKKGRRVNIAHIHNNGWEIEVTPKMRAYLHSIGIHLKKTTRKVVIPKREFMRFSEPARHEFMVLLRKAILK